MTDSRGAALQLNYQKIMKKTLSSDLQKKKTGYLAPLFRASCLNGCFVAPSAVTNLYLWSISAVCDITKD